MNAKPILFNTEMVQAILEGRKTVTRRLIKPQPVFREGETGTPERCDDGSWCFKINEYANVYDFNTKPSYQPGDTLYVRETWAMASDILGSTAGPVYMADYMETELEDLKRKHFRWRPSIHMPKDLARIFLRVKNVQAERLQDITEEQAKAEGVSDRNAFVSLWNSTVDPTERSRYNWEANPWVWAVEFELCKETEG